MRMKPVGEEKTAFYELVGWLAGELLDSSDELGRDFLTSELN